jgi:ABC-2 type transport system ATP-binding protein
MTAILCRGLSKRYGRVAALDRLDLTIPEGSIFGFLGPNGAGKSTAIRILATLSHPTAGDASIAGMRVTPPPAISRSSWVNRPWSTRWIPT